MDKAEAVKKIREEYSEAVGSEQKMYLLLEDYRHEPYKGKGLVDYEELNDELVVVEANSYMDSEIITYIQLLLNGNIVYKNAKCDTVIIDVEGDYAG